MAKVRVKHNLSGYKALRFDPAVQAQCEQLAQSIASRAEAAATGAEYEVVDATTKSGQRSGSAVHTKNYKARLDNSRNNTLLGQLGGM